MRLSTILELLLIFLLIAFAAYGRVIERDVRAIGKKSSALIGTTSASLKQATDNVNKYCVCNENICNCCRDFHIPLVQLAGPGCASLQYLQDDKLAMQLSIGDNILSSNVINGKNPKPVCVALPGGFSKFCGKIYSIKREADKHFKACLGLELRSASDLEASLRVSCFRFGPDGLKLRPAEPLPATFTEASTSADDDYDDIFGLDDDEDDDDEDDDDYEKVSPENNAVSGSTADEQQNQEQEEDDDEDDLLGFSALFDIFTGDDDSSANKNKIKTTTVTPFPSSFAIPILPLTSSTAQPAGNELPITKRPITTSTAITIDPIKSSTASSSVSSLTPSTPKPDNRKNSTETDTASETETGTTYYPMEDTTKALDDNEDATTVIDLGITEKDIVPDQPNKFVPNNKINTKIIEKVKLKKTKIPNKQKISVTSQSANAINKQPVKPQEHHQSSTDNDDLDDDYDYNDSQEDDENEEVSSEQNDKDESQESDKQVEEETAAQNDDDYEEEVDDDEDEDEEEDEEEEDAVISALVDDEQEKDDKNAADKHKKKVDKVITNKTSGLQEDDTDYGYGLAELLARKQRPSRTRHVENEGRQSSRQSKVMRF